MKNSPSFILNVEDSNQFWNTEIGRANVNETPLMRSGTKSRIRTDGMDLIKLTRNLISVVLFSFLLCATAAYAGDNFMDFIPVKTKQICPHPTENCKVEINKDGKIVFSNQLDPNDPTVKVKSLYLQGMETTQAFLKAGHLAGFNFGVDEGWKGKKINHGFLSKGPAEYKAGWKSGYQQGFDLGKFLKKMEPSPAEKSVKHDKSLKPGH